ncbi:MAG: methyltransferase [Pseudonocardiaceae bacterium]|nr:methyltransferase [Pseudonocardiaceae bacterium]
MTESSTVQADAHRTLMQWLWGAMATQVVSVAVRLELADAIGNDGADIDDLAKTSDIPAQRLIRLLRALVGLGLCTEARPGRFTLTPAGSLLRKQNPGSLHDYARLVAEPIVQESWARLEFSMRTGRIAFEEAFGMPAFEYLANDPELSALFNSAMSQGTREAAAVLPEHYDFSQFTTVTDVGGGDGTLLTAILKRHPDLQGVVFDTAEGAAPAAETVRAAGLSGRCTVATGDFCDAVPAGADLYLLKSVLHNWDDDRAATILGNCRAAMPTHGRLLIIDPVLPDTADSTIPAENPYLIDLDMLVLVGGKERTRADFEQLCTRAGFTIADVTALPPQNGLSVIEAAPTRTR